MKSTKNVRFNLWFYLYKCMLYLCTCLRAISFPLVFKENYPAGSTFQVGKLPMVRSNTRMNIHM